MAQLVCPRAGPPLHEPRLRQASGVIAYPAAGAGHRKGTALSNQDAAPPLSGLDVKASQ